MFSTPPWNKQSRFALFVGIFVSLITLVLFAVVFPMYNYSRPPVWGLLWYTVGTFLLATVPVFLFVQYRIVVPLIVTSGLYIVSVVATWTRIRSAYEDGAALGAGPTSLALLLLFWVVPFALLVFLGGTEYGLKRLFHQYRSRPSSGE